MSKDAFGDLNASSMALQSLLFHSSRGGYQTVSQNNFTTSPRVPQLMSMPPPLTSELNDSSPEALLSRIARLEASLKSKDEQIASLNRRISVLESNQRGRPPSNHSQNQRVTEMVIEPDLPSSDSPQMSHQLTTGTNVNINGVRGPKRPADFVCDWPDCRRRFRQKQALEVHKNVHTGNRPYPCRYCEKKFKQPAVRSTHERLHTGQKPFNCGICDKSFVTQGQANYHRDYQSCSPAISNPLVDPIADCPQ